MADIARLTQLIEPEATALGFELVRVAMMPSEAGDGGMALQIMAEDPTTGQLVIDQCAALSRRVSDQIDALEEAGEVLIDGDQVTITDRKAGAVTVPFGQIHAAQLVLTDALIAATRPIDTTGVEDIGETDDEEKADD